MNTKLLRYVQFQVVGDDVISNPDLRSCIGCALLRLYHGNRDFQHLWYLASIWIFTKLWYDIMISRNYALLFSWNNWPWCKIRQNDRYQIRTLDIKQGSFFRYRFHIAQSDGVGLYRDCILVIAW